MTEPPDRVLVDPAAREAQAAFEAMMARAREMTPSERLAFGVASGLLHEDGTPRLPEGPPAISIESPLAQLSDALATALDPALAPVEASNMFDTFKLQVASLIERAAKMTGAERSLLGTIHQVLQGKDMVALDEATRTGLRVTARLLYVTNPTEVEVGAACVALRQASGTHVHILESDRTSDD